MLDITWKIFSQTGNIETYLLMKELENVDEQTRNVQEEENTGNTESETLNNL